MFAKFKKPEAKAASAHGPGPEPRPAAPVRPGPARPAEAPREDRDKKRKERLGEIKLELHKALLDNLNLAALEKATEAELRTEITAIASESLEAMGVVLNREERSQISQDLYDEVRGLGPLEVLLKDDSVNDILVNGPQQIFVERNGKLQLTDVTFKDEKHLLRIIDKIVSAVGRRVDESNPYVDARLADGSRFNAMVPPWPWTAASCPSASSRRTSSPSTTSCASAPSPRRWRPTSRRRCPRGSTSSSRAAPARARRRRSTRSRPSSATRSAC